MHLAVFAIDWAKAGGSSFIELCTGVNLAFVAWDKFQERVQFFAVQGQSLISQSTTTLLEDGHRENVTCFFVKIKDRVDSWVKWAWYVTYTASWLSILAGFGMLYCNWSCKWDWMLISPMIIYAVVCGAFWFIFWIVCRFICRIVNIAVGGREDAMEKVKRAARESNPEDW
jgi:hypothetical protein